MVRSLAPQSLGFLNEQTDIMGNRFFCHQDKRSAAILSCFWGSITIALIKAPRSRSSAEKSFCNICHSIRATTASFAKNNNSTGICLSWLRLTAALVTFIETETYCFGSYTAQGQRDGDETRCRQGWVGTDYVIVRWQKISNCNHPGFGKKCKIGLLDDIFWLHLSKHANFENDETFVLLLPQVRASDTMSFPRWLLQRHIHKSQQHPTYCQIQYITVLGSCFVKTFYRYLKRP